MVERFFSRSLNHEVSPSLWLDLLTQNVREAGRIVNVSVVVTRMEPRSRTPPGWNTLSRVFCQAPCKRSFQPCHPGWFDPGRRSGLGGHAAGPMVLQRQGGEVYPRRVHGGVRPVAEMRGMSRDLLERWQCWLSGAALPPAWKGGPEALGFGPAWLGARWAADVA